MLGAKGGGKYLGSILNNAVQAPAPVQSPPPSPRRVGGGKGGKK